MSKLSVGKVQVYTGNGKVSMGVVRTTFLIDEEGMVTAVMPKVKPDANAADVLAMLKGEK